jgi:outer membrane protein OmpA-like peptidoglycan-associated protein
MADRFGFQMKVRPFAELTDCQSYTKDIELSSSVLFDLGKYQLKKEAIEIIKEFATSLENREISRIEIIEYTDNIGSPEDNLILSQRRAAAVEAELRNWLSQNPEIISNGRGEMAPVSSNETEEGREKNRRVQIIIQ